MGKTYITFIIIIAIPFFLLRKEKGHAEVHKVSYELVDPDPECVNFIDMHKQYATIGLIKYGIPVAFSIPHAMLESGHGTSKLSRYHNYWGIKCFKHVYGDVESGCCIDAIDDGEESRFKVFGNNHEAWAFYFKKITSKRYVKSINKNPKLMAENVKRAGWALDAEYVQKMHKVINTYYGEEKR